MIRLIRRISPVEKGALGGISSTISSEQKLAVLKLQSIVRKSKTCPVAKVNYFYILN